MACVKVYLCSNPEDSVEERRALRETVFPKLRDHCKHTHGVEFRVIDPYEASDPRVWPSPQARLQLLEECRATSVGPFFVALVGEQYGAACLPGQVEVSEFQEVLRTCQVMELSTQTLERCYQRDENTIPPSFCLLNQQAYLSQHGVQVEETGEMDWYKALQAVREIFHAVVTRCVLEGNIVPEKAEKYFRSALENDIRFVLENHSGDHITRCLCYIHKITNWRSKRERVHEPCPELHALYSDLLTQLCDHFLPSVVTSCQLVVVYTTTTECDRWRGYTTEMRRVYTEGLCQQLHSDLLSLIDRTITRETARSDDAFYQQADLCHIYSRLYRMESVEAQNVKDYLEQEGTKYPLVLIGGPCTGKTVLLAHCASQVKTWLKDIDPVVVMHFASIDSSLKQLLANVCHQIALSYNQPWGTHPRDITQLKEDFTDLLAMTSSSQHPLVLILDGLDQLPKTDGPSDLTWLPNSLPSHVKLLISTTPTKSGTLLALRTRYSDSHLFLKLEQMESKSCSQMLTDLLQPSNRRITSGQQMYVNQALKRCPLPLYVELLHRQASLWSSEAEVTGDTLFQGVHDSIDWFLGHLEEEHGKMLVTRTIGYLTLSRYGMTGAELTDILSCDDEILSRFLPSEDCTPYKFRVPQVVVERLLLNLRGFLMKRYGSQELFWISRHFPLVIHKRYFSTFEVVQEMHHMLANYFSSRWAFGRAKPLITPNPYLETHKTLVTSDKTPMKIYIDRQPSGQPWVFDSLLPVSPSTCTSESAHVNLRKVLELPFHLRESGRLEELGRGVMMLLGYQQAMLKAKLMGELVSWLQDTSQLVFPRELGLLASILRDAACLLQYSPADLPLVMQAKLFPFLEVFPELEDYAKQICLDNVRNESGVSMVISPAPSVPSTCWALPEAKASPIIEVSGAQSGTLVLILSTGSAWAWNGSGSEGFKLPHSSKLKFTDVKSSGNVFVLSTQCNKLLLWDMNAPLYFHEVQTLGSGENLNTTLSVDGVLVAKDKMFVWWNGLNYISVCDIALRVELIQLQCSHSVTCVSISSDGLFIYCGQDKSTVSIFDVHSSLLASCTNLTGTSLIRLILCEGEDKMTCIDSTGSVFVWDVETITKPELIKECLRHKSQEEVLNTDLSEEHNVLLICKKQQILLWDTDRWDVEDQFNAPQGKTFVQAMLDQDCHFIFALLDGCPFLLVWKWTTGQCVLSLDTGSTQALKLLKQGATHLTAFTANQVITWDKDLICAAASIPKSGARVMKVVVEPLGDHFYTTDGTELVWRWEASSGKVEGHFLHPSRVETLALSADSEYLVAIASGDIYVWRTTTGENLHRICASQVSQILITPKGNFAVSLSERGLSRVWKLGSGHVVCNIHLYLRDAVISPESTFLLGLHGGHLKAVSLWSGFVSKRFSCSSHWSVLAFQPLLNHADYVIVITTSGALYSWKVTEETVCQQFQMPESFLCQPEVFQLSLDGSYAILSITGSNIHILDVYHGRLCSVKAEGQVQQACLDISGRYAIYICDSSGKARGCPCDLHVRPVLNAIRVSDGKRVGKFYLCKCPSALSLSEDLCVYVGFEDGSVGVYAISDGVEGGTTTRSNRTRAGKGMPCPCDEALIWSPLATPSLTWSEAASVML